MPKEKLIEAEKIVKPAELEKVNGGEKVAGKREKCEETEKEVKVWRIFAKFKRLRKQKSPQLKK